MSAGGPASAHGGARHCDRLFVCVTAGSHGSPGSTRPSNGGRADSSGPTASRGGSGQAAPEGKSGGKAKGKGSDCKFEELPVQPPDGSSLTTPGTAGTLYCAPPFPFVGDADVPAGEQPPQVNPLELAQQAVDKMLLRGPDIGITPEPGGRGVVGMPVYMWTHTGATTYGPNTASASAGGITVTATAKVQKIVWEMGDGHTVTCRSAGTPYKASYGKTPSPDCGYRYEQASTSRTGGTYHVTATSTWAVDWEGGGASGQFTEVRDSAVDIEVAEVQVLN
ncbi:MULTISPECIES: ATP/GTP-binding protein [unclassified Streptomyces]|uniref:ATP/GTP-binding protein n=1 Tax=unclassified Streptomyces TaxID=2593676 RepID=UPI001EF0BD2F|nr:MULTISPECIES: ATP/GTP-binding protein [unclassified Streptomyces]